MLYEISSGTKISLMPFHRERSIMLTRGIWHGPVSFRLHPFGEFQTIKSSSEALDFLLAYWPAEEAQAYQDALIICRSAMEGKSNPDIAKDAFIVAAYEAGIFMRFENFEEDCTTDRVRQAPGR